MDPVEISAALTVLELAIKEEPAVAADLQKLFASGKPTPADFAALRASIEAETYGEFVPASSLPASQTGS